MLIINTPCLGGAKHLFTLVVENVGIGPWKAFIFRQTWNARADRGRPPLNVNLGICPTNPARSLSCTNFSCLSFHSDASSTKQLRRARLQSKGRGICSTILKRGAASTPATTPRFGQCVTLSQYSIEFSAIFEKCHFRARILNNFYIASIYSLVTIYRIEFTDEWLDRFSRDLRGHSRPSVPDSGEAKRIRLLKIALLLSTCSA